MAHAVTGTTSDQSNGAAGSPSDRQHADPEDVATPSTNTKARLMSLEIRGFRAFGLEARTLQTDEPLVVLHAGNSQGKTSLAEAIEFLFSGRSSRRELLGGAKAEYDGSLRNAHLPDGDQVVYVEALVRDPEGTPRRVRRELQSDFGRGTECASCLTVDGVEVNDLSSVGITLAEGPVCAPVLLQHILRHVLSTEPKQRVGYFKALLELTDLDQLRVRVKAQRTAVETEQPGVALRSAMALTERAFEPLVAQLRTSAARETNLAEATALVERLILDSADLVLAGSAPIGGLTNFGALQAAIDQTRREQREAKFSTAPFEVAPPPALLPAAPDLSEYGAALAAADTQAAQLAPVIEAFLSIDRYADVVEPIDCPICGTAQALHGDRIEQLRRHLMDTRAIDDAARAATRSLATALNELDQLLVASSQAVPAVTTWDAHTLVAARERLAELSVDSELATAAHVAGTHLRDAVEKVKDAINDARLALTSALSAVSVRDPLPLARPELAAPLQPGRDDDPDRSTHPIDIFAALTLASKTYSDACSQLFSAVDAATRDRAAIPGLSELSELQAQRGALASDLVAEASRHRTVKRLTAAERVLREASSRVLDARFQQMSDTITDWWRSIRPEELVDFGGVKRRAGGALFVNLVAALHADPSSNPVEREALGVYSDSQLNALGLSIFLARTQLQGSPIVVLDDPIPGSDSDHRSTFVQNTLSKLLDDGVQVVLSTFDGKLVQHARAIHDWRGLSAYELTLLDATAGTEVTQTSDVFSQLLLEAEDNLHSPTPRSRRAACNSLRSAAERLAKQIIATGRTHDGNPTGVADIHAEASVLGKLVPLVRGFALHNHEKGQWQSFNSQLNPGNHDDDVPSTIELKQVRSNLRKISKDHRAKWPNGLVV